MYYDNLHGLLRVAAVGVPAYIALILLLRVSGKRTLSKMNAFDLVVTIALGSTLASIITSKGVALAEGLLALGLLVGLQFGIAWLSVRSTRVGGFVKSQPRLLYYRGVFIEDALWRERVLRDEVLAAMREQGLASPDQALAVVLETSGEFSVVRAGESDEAALPAGEPLPVTSL